MMKRYLKYICMLLVVLSGITSCSDVEFFDSEDEVVSMTYTIGLDDDVSSRAIGDGSQVDKLYVGIYEGNMEVERLEANINDGKADITVELFKGRTYDLAFWAQSSQTSVYDRTDLKNVDITYPESMTLQEADRMDAFFLLKEDVTVNQMGEDGGALTLTRPFAQLNIASSEADAPEKVKKAILTVNYENSDSLILTFTDFTVGEGDKISYDGLDYYYLVTALLKPGIITANITLLDGNNNEIESFDLNEGNGMELVANYRYNVLGDMITPEELPGWDGVFPTESPLTQDDQNRYIIDEEADVAWLSVKDNAQSLAANSTFIMTVDVNMNNGSGLAAIQLPSGSTLDGDGHTIKGLNLENALLGDVTDITVKNLNIEETTIVNTSDDVIHVGVLVNTLKGSNTFSNIHVKNSSVSTQNGAAGGIVGHITRDSDEEELEVIFDNCHVKETSVDGNVSEGHFVGLFRGYDNNEILKFNDNCTLEMEVQSRTGNFVSPYREGNEGAWLASNDYSKYNGWLGDEEFYRGMVMYGDKRFIPCWDGVKKVTPLKDGTTQLIYSAFDLANLQGTNAGTIRLMENVDMEYDLDGASKDGVRNHIFTALSTLTKLEGNGKTIYNISIRDNYYGGFVKSESCATTFENVTFDGADIRVTHDTSSGNGYVGTLRGFAWAATTIKNVKVKNGFLYGVNKMGGLCGGIFSTLTCENSSVEKYYIENYDSKILDDLFYAYGECGGLIGMITNAPATISNCSVNQTTMNCIGQNDKWLIITIPGRHVNDFIGDIRLDGGQRVDLIGNTVSGNSFTNRKKDTHSSKCAIVGKCYKISGTAGSVYIGTTKVF